MTQGSSYPLAGIKIGQAPAHRLTTPTPTLAPGVSAAKSDTPESVDRTSTSAPAEASLDKVKPQASESSSRTSDAKKHVDTTKTEQPSQESNEVEVTSSEQISEHGLPTNGRSNTHASNSTSSSSSIGRSGAPDRRTAMGVASVRIAGRLTQNELGSRTGDIRTPDTSVGPDELLQLLGEYLVSGGLQNPEIHVRSNGQTIVLDLLNPAKGYR
ncbi:hypothetical protein HQ346_24385 [Rhodococcus sp. BP-252]|uniref:Uncharacterized protein n=1 Tax=Rhodococcoides kyotonense TaxID=398843 RepID=A0A177YJS8_9NOCA|nr:MULTISPECIES: hypothetical protein [Rhodococcus]MBY6414753.1 hypothetical protein [Rhodococcus sp. BP-320]MBY6419657.1 hypothetical protein [Rhodococcus sp. BP-321]MBY6424623.1 hypothetical protein [Rhodococcus sp. BP-324]MBY6429620.1 hypothetical protein [Rhodococcus sp. BP-323]MBY6434603.1 hypothetical protein [Rhodococcus sp. BP-322]